MQRPKPVMQTTIIMSDSLLEFLRKAPFILCFPIEPVWNQRERCGVSFDDDIALLMLTTLQYID